MRLSDDLDFNIIFSISFFRMNYDIDIKNIKISPLNIIIRFFNKTRLILLKIYLTHQLCNLFIKIL